MKSKKFDAHKKHFDEKENKLRQELNYNIQLVDKLSKKDDLLLKEDYDRASGIILSVISLGLG
jgi:hypothetical protein